MLVLKRLAGQVIRIGETIRVIVVSVDRGEVELAIEAPKDVPIVREKDAYRERRAYRGRVA